MAATLNQTRPSFCRKVFRKIRSELSIIAVKLRVNLLWPVYSALPGWKGTTDKDYRRQLIVSLTTFPPRIRTVHITIRSLLMQDMKPNKIILWLAEDEFPGKNKDLPAELLSLRKYGLEINYCENIRSYKKLIPTLRLYPEAEIVTADDDIYYRHNWLSSLYAEHVRHPEDICAHRITKFYIDDSGSFRIVGGGYEVYPRPSFLHKFTGVGGVIYPLGCFHEDILRSEIFTEICTTNDDVWFWLMAVLTGRRIRVTEKNRTHLALAYVGETQKGPSLCHVNDKGEKLFWKDFHRMLERYPQLDKILRDEYELMTGTKA
ncbi:MAG: hypothetical protein IJG65_09605 [Synergistaceae bacterium]|nr:hypothetical protein [Synergistaceae bacterium]